MALCMAAGVGNGFADYKGAKRCRKITSNSSAYHRYYYYEE